ncbi:uncharacterized protein [Montipora foliosa]|uniref:uncharacterized protein isoform X2 n=1 Tax=Montipora foliosa TaxID=591990 RepID=UPI0035F1F755
MAFKAFLFCFSLFVIAASGASLYKCGEDKKKDSVSEYNVKVKTGRKEINEKITIDTEDETETFQIEDDDNGKIDVVYDFKRNMSMYRINDRKVCLLRNSTDKLPIPKKLIEGLQSEAQQGSIQEGPKETTEYALGDPVYDRSFLSDEMACMCAKLPIYYMVPESTTVTVQEERSAKRRKRRVTVTVTLETPWFTISVSINFD